MLTGHGLPMRVLLPLLQCTLEIKRQNILPKFRLSCTLTEIQQPQSYYKWFEIRLVKVKKSYYGVKKGFATVTFYYETCMHLL